MTKLQAQQPRIRRKTRKGKNSKFWVRSSTFQLLHERESPAPEEQIHPSHREHTCSHVCCLLHAVPSAKCGHGGYTGPTLETHL